METIRRKSLEDDDEQLVQSRVLSSSLSTVVDSFDLNHQEYVNTIEDEAAGVDDEAKLKLVQQDPRAHYENVKKKYFLSLGMTKPITGPGLVSKIQRNKTQPALPTSKPFPMDDNLPQVANNANEDPNSSSSSSTSSSIGISTTPISRSRRAISTPAAACLGTAPVPVPSRHPNKETANEEDEEEYEEEYEENEEASQEGATTRTRKKFIPPHEMLARKTDFSVGTARSVALWEQRRRNQMDQT
jgi:hypothetical protein